MDSRDCAPTDLPVNDGGLLGSGVGVDFTGLVRTRRPQKHQALVSPAFGRATPWYGDKSGYPLNGHGWNTVRDANLFTRTTAQ